MSVSALVVAYRSGDALDRLLASLEGEADEVVVVDNAGEEEPRNGIDRLVRPRENLGFAGGANLAAHEASGDVLVFLNPDTVVSKGAIAALERALADQSVGIAMARVRLHESPEQLNSSGTVVHLSGIGWAGGYGEPADSLAEAREVAAPSGAAMAMRAETFRELGGFAEELFMYLEDLEFGWRARLAGYRVVVDPAADVLHEYEYGRNPGKSYQLERNRLFFVLTAYSARLLVLLAPLLVVTELGMMLIAVREGWFGDKLAGWGWLLRNAGTIARRRRQTQRLRKVPDRELVRFLTPVFDPGMIPVPGLLRAANPLVSAYWSLVRRAL